MNGSKNLRAVNKLLRRIAITGPESTGKSSLCFQLAKHFKTYCVEEYARNYIDDLKRPYNLDDIIKIAKHQLSNENKLAEKANEFLFCDTELIVTKIWSEHKFGICPEWILENIESHKYELYLLCNIDLEWEADPQREHPHLRQHFFDLYKQELEKREYNFGIVSGEGDERLQNAIKLINNLLFDKT